MLRGTAPGGTWVDADVVDVRARGGRGRDVLCTDQWFSKRGPWASARPGNL